MGGLVRYVVFFVMKLKTRAVEIAGITRQPDEAWMTQVARNLTDPREGFLRSAQHLILDRDPLYTACAPQKIDPEADPAVETKTGERVYYSCTWRNPVAGLASEFFGPLPSICYASYPRRPVPTRSSQRRSCF
jgi:hypothetical protein